MSVEALLRLWTGMLSGDGASLTLVLSNPSGDIAIVLVDMFSSKVILGYGERL